MMVTDKGQVTIPKQLRDEFGILPGTEVQFLVRDGQLVVQKLGTGRRGKGVVERLRGRGDVLRSTDELLALTRGE